MTKTIKRLISYVLVAVLLGGMLPLSVFAEEYRESLGTAQAANPSTPAPTDQYVVGEVVEKRSEFSKEFKLSDGHHMTVVYPISVHYQRDGAWEEIDNTLKTSRTGSATQYTTTAGDWEVSLPQELSKDTPVSVTKDGYTVSFRMTGENRLLQTAGSSKASSDTRTVAQAQTSAAQIRQTDLTKARDAVKYPEVVPEKLISGLEYKNVYNNTDIRYELGAYQLKESVILNSLDPAVLGYRYTLDTGGLVPVLQEDGSITLVAPDSRQVVMTMPAPYMIDAAQAENRDVEVTLTPDGKAYTLTYTMPRKWLASSERVWPVVLDPLIIAESNTGNILDAFVGTDAGESYMHGTMYCGYNPLYGKTRTYIQYHYLPHINSADVVVHAELSLLRHGGTDNTTTVEAHKVNGYWDSKTIVWSNQPSWGARVEDYAQVGGNDRYFWEITDVVRDWYASSNNGVMLKSQDSVENSGVENWKKFYTIDFSIYDPETWPWLTITFRNSNGLESYWDYTASSAGRAGTGYVNSYTGNLVWVRNDMGFGGNRMPVSISHIYNANDASQNLFGAGYGWRTNFHQRVYHWDGSVDELDYYVWEDEDGTKHYFLYDSEEAAYLDEDGLELKLTTTGSGTTKYCITDKYGNCSYFDTVGRLTKQENNQQSKSSITVTYTDSSGYRINTITDGAGRVYAFDYSSSGLLNRIRYLGKGTSEQSYVSFGYTDSHLTSITDKDGEICRYHYTTGNLLSSVQDIDGYTLNYTYNLISSGKPSRVSSVSESYNSVNGGSLSIEYAHKQTTFTDVSGNVQIMQFNDWGNTVSVQDGEGRAQYAKYATDTSETAKGNQLTVSSKLQNTVGNVLDDSSFEGGTTWYNSNSSVTNTVTTEVAYQGNHSLKMTNTAASGTQSINCYAVTVAPGETYTFSAYVKTDTTFAMLALWDKESVWNNSSFLPAGNDWTRMEVSYTNTFSVSKNIYAVVHTAESGSLYVDCVQVEKTPTASRYNLIENGDFRNTSAWSSTSGRTTLSPSAAPQLSTNVYQMTGDPNAANRISQTVQVSGSQGDTFILSGWAKGDSAPLKDDREFSLIATFLNASGTAVGDSVKVTFNPDNNSSVAWQYAAEAIVAPAAYSAVKIEVAYDYNVNTVYFDGIQLYKEAFGNSYTYDADGNVTSVKDLQKQTTTYEYTNNNLTKQTLPTGAVLTYTYDNYHNVKTATTDTGMVYSFGYDAWGNNTSVSIGSGITATATYTSDGNRMASSTDAAGNTTTYSYNENTGVLEWVKYPKDTDATRTNYEYDDMYRLEIAAATTNTGTALTASYTYADDLLTAITTGSTTYSFAYGNFALRSNIQIGSRTLASYGYTDRTNYLASLDYGNGDKVQYEYDKQGRVTKQTYEDGDTVTYKYDNNGALATVTDSATGRTTTYYYDFTDRLMKYVESGSGYSHSVGYGYDTVNNLTALVETINGVTRTTSYTYDDDNRVTSVATDGISESYTYDGYGRITQKVTKNGSTVILTETYTYKTGASGNPTSQVATLRSVSAGLDVTYTYSYDANGNITSVSDGSHTTDYTYDSANQLTRENNQAVGKTWVWTYDDAGNILSKKEYAYTTGSVGSVLSTIDYTYDSTWGDLLTGWNGKTISSDAIGNTLSDGTNTYTWEHGRQLASISNTSYQLTYAYNTDGLRVQKILNGTTHNFVYCGDKVVQETYNGNVLDIIYDASGHPYCFKYNGTLYYYITNLQGDVMQIVDSSGAVQASYVYDAWGNTVSATGSAVSINPLRYRGYFYDGETGLYYVSSRYYDPEIGRFVNADSLVSTGQGVLGCNMFSYCLNNPVNFVDRSGNNAEAVQWWTSTMWWLCGADTVLPVGDIIYGAGILILGIYALTVADEVTVPQISLEEEKEEVEPEPPDVTYPGDDPAKAPEGTEWKGKGEQGSKQGNYHNPETGESWHPDLDHPEPIGPHWDYRDTSGTWWRIGPGDMISLK